MAKGQQKSNREVRKPKSSKSTKPAAAQASPFTNPRNMMKPIGSKKTAK